MASLVPELLLVTCILLCLPQGQKLGDTCTVSHLLGAWCCLQADGLPACLCTDSSKQPGPPALQQRWFWWELGHGYTAEGFLEL